MAGRAAGDEQEQGEEGQGAERDHRFIHVVRAGVAADYRNPT